MTTPAVVQIYDEIEARAKNIQKRLGYMTDTRKIERSKISPLAGGDFPLVSFWPTFMRVEEGEYGDDLHTLSGIIGLMDTYSKHDRPYSDVAAEFAADLTVAMNRSTAAPKVSDSQDLDLGGLVSSLLFTTQEAIISSGQDPYCGVLLAFEIQYSTPQGDPFTINDMTTS